MLPSGPLKQPGEETVNVGGALAQPFRDRFEEEEDEGNRYHVSDDRPHICLRQAHAPGVMGQGNRAAQFEDGDHRDQEGAKPDRYPGNRAADGSRKQPASYPG